VQCDAALQALTYLLMNELGGDSKTLFVVNVAPEAEHWPETRNTLAFAKKLLRCETGNGGSGGGAAVTKKKTTTTKTMTASASAAASTKKRRATSKAVKATTKTMRR
jgi:hypothetical protein